MGNRKEDVAGEVQKHLNNFRERLDEKMRAKDLPPAGDHIATSYLRNELTLPPLADVIDAIVEGDPELNRLAVLLRPLVKNPPGTQPPTRIPPRTKWK